ncbi:VTT domain-containing protein [Candidatus Dependentiae bacterium]|nr:VTT domain-containing protein [Candidatus Dependentiae bacterium]
MHRKVALWFIRLSLPAILLATFFYLYWTGYFSWYSLQTLQEHALQLRCWVHQHCLLAITMFIVWYCSVVATCLPGGALSTIAAGYLFGWSAIGLVWGCSLVGASLVFWLARTIAHPWLYAKFGKQLHHLYLLIEQHGGRILLLLRLLPVVPFFLLNILGGLTHIRYGAYIVATAIGILPGIVLFVAAGQQIQQLQCVSDVFTPSVIAIFSGATAVILIPMLIPYLPQRWLFWVTK